MKNADMPAMPVSTNDTRWGHQDSPDTWQHPGLTKRELFAAMAMQGLLSDNSLNIPVEDYARAAVDYADYLLAALETKP